MKPLEINFAVKNQIWPPSSVGQNIGATGATSVPLLVASAPAV
jgi:hypothetical protein